MPQHMELDEKNKEILKIRQAAFLNRKVIKSGDFIHFPDGEYRRATHVWTDKNNQPEGIQTTIKNGADSSFYMGEGYMSFSGSLDPSIPYSTMTRTNATKEGNAWFFDHDWARANGGVYVKVLCPVWECSLDSESGWKIAREEAEKERMES
jgi:hypothetical protein